ncbi:MAG: helix-turn-helix transcriptional regulator [Christensenellales bacterium]|jgi:transcriptional regulator with XRE-family HTH domain
MNLETATRLMMLRKEHGLSQEELAEKIGVSRQAVSKWERAESSPDLDNMVLLAKLYNVSLDALLLSDDFSVKQEQTAQNTEQDSSFYAESFSENFSESFSEGSADIYGGESYSQDDETDEESGKSLPRSPIWEALDGVYPVLVVALFLFLGFAFNLWNPAWILFLTIPLYYTMTPGIRMLSRIRSGEENTSPLRAVKKMLDGSYPILVAFAFLLTGTLTRYWHPAWMWFLTIPLYYVLMPAIVKAYER